MSKLARDGTAELVSRDQILRRDRGQGNYIFPVQLTALDYTCLSVAMMMLEERIHFNGAFFS